MGAPMWRFRTDLTGGQGGAQLSTFYVLSGGSVSVDDAGTAIGSFWSALSGEVSADYTWQVESDVAVIDSAEGTLTGMDHLASAPAGTFGDTGDPLPWETQGLIRWGTSTIAGTRFLKGHTFIPAPTETANTGGVPTSGYISALASAAADLVTALSPEFVIWSRAHATTGVITGHGVWTKWSGLKSRRT